jgi:hypothetical protein
VVGPFCGNGRNNHAIARTGYIMQIAAGTLLLGDYNYDFAKKALSGQGFAG